jgi:hypothetical protein
LWPSLFPDANGALGITRPTSAGLFDTRATIPWSGRRFGKLKVPSLSRDAPLPWFAGEVAKRQDIADKFCHNIADTTECEDAME